MGLAALELDAEFKFHFAEVLNGDKAQPAVMKPSLRKSLKFFSQHPRKAKIPAGGPKKLFIETANLLVVLLRGRFN